MSSEVTVWNKVMGAALSMPGVKVDRDEFLKKELKIYCSPEQLEQAISSRPINGVSKDVIDRIASACINSHTAKVTAVSAIAGIPGGLAMAGTIPAETRQQGQQHRHTVRHLQGHLQQGGQRRADRDQTKSVQPLPSGQFVGQDPQTSHRQRGHSTVD